MEELEDIWQRLNLTSEDGEEINVAKDKLEKEIKKEDYCVVGKIHMDRAIGQDVIQKTMQKVWQTSKAFSIQTINPNLFLITFELLDDKQRVYFGHPWLFYVALFSINIFLCLYSSYQNGY